nr:uncharacterized protein LOC104106285 [Nicotiana tomentosiformis]
MDDDSGVKGKKVDTGISSETLSEKEIKLFVKHPHVVSSHISSYTNTNIVSDLKEKLTPEQYKLFYNTCFGSFIEMKHCEVQHQLFRCFMVLQLEESHDDSFSINMNGTKLCFSIREFPIVTCLNYVSDAEDFLFNTKKPNRIVDTYFGGAKNVKKKDLVKCFDDKNWGYVFQSYVVRSISKKMNSQKKYYRIAGIPLAMQVWFYECCSKIDPKITLRVDNRMPRILNWKSRVNQLTYAYLVNNMFNDQGNVMKYSNIQPTATELAVIQVPPDGVDVEKSPIPSDNNDDDSDDFSPTPPLQPKKKFDASVGPSSSPPHKKHKHQLSDPSTTDSPIPHVLAIPQTKFPPTDKIEFKKTVLSSKKPADSKSDNLYDLRQDLNSFKDYVMGEFTSLRTLINENFKKLFENAKVNQNTERFYQRKKYTGRHDGGIQMSTEANLHNNPKC